MSDRHIAKAAALVAVHGVKDALIVAANSDGAIAREASDLIPGMNCAATLRAYLYLALQRFDPSVRVEASHSGIGAVVRFLGRPPITIHGSELAARLADALAPRADIVDFCRTCRRA